MLQCPHPHVSCSRAAATTRVLFYKQFRQFHISARCELSFRLPGGYHHLCYSAIHSMDSIRYIWNTSNSMLKRLRPWSPSALDWPYPYLPLPSQVLYRWGEKERERQQYISGECLRCGRCGMVINNIENASLPSTACLIVHLFSFLPLRSLMAHCCVHWPARRSVDIFLLDTCWNEEMR